MERNIPVFRRSNCAYRQLFWLTDSMHPGKLSTEQRLDVYPLFIEQATDAIATDLVERERMITKEDDLQQQVFQVRRKLVTLSDQLYDFRRLAGGHSTYGAMYRQCSDRLMQLSHYLERMYGREHAANLKIEAELMATMKPRLLVRLKKCARQMEQAGIPQEWTTVVYKPMAAALTDKEGPLLTWGRWYYLCELAGQLEEQLHTGRFTLDMLQQLLLQHNFNSELFSYVWKQALLRQLDTLPDAQARLELLQTTGHYLSSLRYTKEKSLFEQHTGIKKELKGWVSYLAEGQFRVGDGGESEVSGSPLQKRIQVNASVLLLSSFCKVLQKTGFFSDKDLSHILLIVQKFTSLRRAAIPSASNLIRSASCITVSAVDEVIELLHSCLSVATDMKKKLVEEERKQRKKAAEME